MKNCAFTRLDDRLEISDNKIILLFTSCRGSSRQCWHDGHNAGLLVNSHKLFQPNSFVVVMLER